MKTFFFGNIKEGTVSIDCPRCGERNMITVVKPIVQAVVKMELVRK